MGVHFNSILQHEEQFRTMTSKHELSPTVRAHFSGTQSLQEANP